MTALIFLLFVYLAQNPWGNLVYSAPSSNIKIVSQPCDISLWDHVYHKDRLVVKSACVAVTGTIVDATHGKRRSGCRVEADGDLHCFLRLDADQEMYLNEFNRKNEDGNLVFEPICVHKVTQQDALEACKNFKQKLHIPLVGSHVRITGAWVLDTQHGHMEIHPVTSIEVLPPGEVRASR